MKSNLEWKFWGETDPLWGVASLKARQRNGTKPWTDKDFYSVGSDWIQFDRVWQAMLGHDRRSILEIGCGAGRITKCLSDEFDQVVAIDVSAGMIEYAKRHIEAKNIEWRITDGDTLPLEDTSIDAAFSCYVFQHFPDNAAQISTFAEIYRVLRPSGTFLIHLPLHSFPQCNLLPAILFRWLYSTFLHLSSLKARVRRLMLKWFNLGYMHGVSHEIGPLLTSLKWMGFEDLGITLLTEGRIPCVYGRKPNREASINSELGIQNMRQ